MPPEWKEKKGRSCGWHKWHPCPWSDWPASEIPGCGATSLWKFLGRIDAFYQKLLKPHIKHLKVIMITPGFGQPNSIIMFHGSSAASSSSYCFQNLHILSIVLSPKCILLILLPKRNKASSFTISCKQSTQHVSWRLACFVVAVVLTICWERELPVSSLVWGKIEI